MKLWFHVRLPEPGKPGGVTVSKRETLPAGDFGITEYVWPDRTLWFVDSDKFTASERQAAHDGRYEKPKGARKQLVEMTEAECIEKDLIAMQHKFSKRRKR